MPPQIHIPNRFALQKWNRAGFNGRDRRTPVNLPSGCLPPTGHRSAPSIITLCAPLLTRALRRLKTNRPKARGGHLRAYGFRRRPMGTEEGGRDTNLRQVMARTSRSELLQPQINRVGDLAVKRRTLAGGTTKQLHQFRTDADLDCDPSACATPTPQLGRG
jgi:hypothetical protein